MFEVAPHIIPQGFATPVEVKLWGMFFSDRENRLKAESRQTKGQVS